jgi:hypothetical protein
MFMDLFKRDFTEHHAIKLLKRSGLTFLPEELVVSHERIEGIERESNSYDKEARVEKHNIRFTHMKILGQRMIKEADT